MFGLFKNSKQDWQAQVNTNEEVRHIAVQAGNNLLKSALEAGFPWPHDCRVGSCRTCRCKLKSGKVKELSDFAYVLTQEELQEGMILACQSALRSDVTIEVELTDPEQAVSVSTHQAVIHSMKPLTHDIIELVLKTEEMLPRTARAGQYAEISTPAIPEPRSYSFAKAPEDENPGEVTFYIRHVPGGEFTGWLFDGDHTGTEMTVSLPFGGFWLRQSEGNIVCIAGGSGLAPVKALLEHAFNKHTRRQVLFLFGARTQQDLYCLEEMQRLQRRWKGKFRFVPVLSEEPDDSDWQGARGMVTDYMQQTYLDSGQLDISACQGYLCGPPGMVDAATNLLSTAGMPSDAIFFDKFLDASSMPGGR